MQLWAWVSTIEIRITNFVLHSHGLRHGLLLRIGINHVTTGIWYSMGVISYVRTAHTTGFHSCSGCMAKGSVNSSANWQRRRFFEHTRCF